MSAAEQTNGADRSRMSRMPRFSFQIRCSKSANEHAISLPCAEDARQEASQLCCDMIRDIIASLEPRMALGSCRRIRRTHLSVPIHCREFQALDQHKAQSRA